MVTQQAEPVPSQGGQATPSTSIRIAGRTIGTGSPAYIIAEMSGNHNGDFQRAVNLVKAAKDAGVDAVKLQTYTSDTMTLDCDNEYFRINGGPWAGRVLYELYNEAYTPWDWQPKLKEVADDLRIDLFSSPFDSTAVDFLEAMNVPAFKIASFENVDLPFLRRVAQTKKPIIMSTGMASLAEIDEAVRTLREAGATELALLKCTSAYPSSPEQVNLRTLPHLSAAFNVPVGLSDHTLESAVPVAAVTLGACIIEKHFTLSRSEPGPDTAFSLEPDEFKAMVHAVRTAEKALGVVSYDVMPDEAKSLVFRRSLFVVEDMKAGETFTSETVRSIRPGHGLHTRELPEILGRTASRDIQRGTPLSWQLVGS